MIIFFKRLYVTTKSFILIISFFTNGLSPWTLLPLTFPYIPSIFSFLFFQSNSSISYKSTFIYLTLIPRQQVSVPSYRQKKQKLLLVGSQIYKGGVLGSFNKSKVKRRTARFLPDRHDYVRM